MRLQYRVIDNEFNRAWYRPLIGKVFDAPPAYAYVKVCEAVREPLYPEHHAERMRIGPEAVARRYEGQ